MRDAFFEAVEKLKDREVDSIWAQVFTICAKSLVEEPESVREMRSSKKWCQHVVEGSIQYLHDQ